MSAMFVTSSSSLSPWPVHSHSLGVTGAGLSSNPARLQPSPACMQGVMAVSRTPCSYRCTFFMKNNNATPSYLGTWRKKRKKNAQQKCSTPRDSWGCSSCG